MQISTARQAHRHRMLILLLTAIVLFLVFPRAAGAADRDSEDDGIRLRTFDEAVQEAARKKSAKPEAPPPSTESPAPRTTGRAIDVLPESGKMGHWTIGFGPFIGRHLSAGNAMYNFTGGYVWDINPRASVKVLGESNFSSGADHARFLNAAVGMSVYLPNGAATPYLAADMGYGFARNAEAKFAEGFSLGFGAGYEFFRTTETTLDLMLRYAVIFDDFTDGGPANPSVLGIRMAVNF